MREEVLDAAQFPEVTYEGMVRERNGGLDVDGQLEMMGRTAPLQLSIERADGWLTGEVELRPSRWGIVPYKAMLGAIQLQDRVIIRFRLREPEVEQGSC
jgi:polyisoprenoid-binding protein YceI